MTLDKVIKALSIDRLHEIGRYDGAGWYLVTEDELNEARQYLQAYKVSMDDLIALRAYWAEQQANNPITWDELNQMEGKPVWVEALLYKQWAIIAYIGVDHIRFEGANLYAPECRVYMGADNGWQAYRKERS